MLSMVPDSLDELVTTTEAANAVGLGVSTISMWAKRGYISPSGLDEHARPMYRLIDILRCARDTRRRAIGQSRIA